MNQIYLTGYVGKFIEAKITPTGLELLEFSISHKSSNVEMQWFKVTCWRDLAKQLNGKIKHGDYVLVTGKISVNTWTGKDNTERSKIQITANTVDKLAMFEEQPVKLGNFGEALKEDDINF